MTDLYLYGDIDATFPEITASFANAAAKRGATIALLLQSGSGWEEYVDRYRRPFEAAADVAVRTVVPVDDAVPPRGIETIRRAGGIFMGGGHTPAYHRAFVASPVGELIRGRVAEGVPYGGVSAGAMLACATSVLAGNADGHRPLMAGVAPGELSNLVLGSGLGLIPDAIVQPHFAEMGCFPRLHAAVLSADASLGIGIDEPAGAHITGDRLEAFGSGAVWLLRRRNGRFEIETLGAGETVTLGAD